MSDPTALSALAARLDRIEALLARLVTHLEGTSPAPAAPAPSSGLAAPGLAAPVAPHAHEPPRIKVAPPTPRLHAGAPVEPAALPTEPAGAGTPTAAAASVPSSSLTPPGGAAHSSSLAPGGAAPASTPAAEAHPALVATTEGGPLVPGPDAPVEAVLLRLFEAALAPSPDETWAVLIHLFHSSQLVGPRSLDHFKGFAWPRLRRNARIYLQDGTPGSFRVAYTDPHELRGHEKEVRVFMKANDERMPVPLVLTRDPAAGNAWRISNISL
jgi:hypothetical protein